ncbi:MAG: hypothetical protein KDB80_12205, partial [Planctomycetes bacterium]|nr:hypothetical protein [Planctomycetota bacterium]
TAQNFDHCEIDLEHSDAAPDFTIDPFSAFPASPNSGLDPSYALNVSIGSTPINVYSGPYSVQPGAVRANGYVDYPTPQSAFAYNGRDSLLIDIRTSPNAVPAPAQNGQVVRIMAFSAPTPFARVHADGTPAAPLDPNTTTSGTGDNVMYDYEIEFVRVKTVATSPWRPGAPSADYRTPLLGSVTPPGTSIQVEYRGAQDATGSGATAWSSSVDVADGHPFVQFRVELVGDPTSGAVPELDTLVIPY